MEKEPVFDGLIQVFRVISLISYWMIRHVADELKDISH